MNRDAAIAWELQRFVIHPESLDRKFKLPEGWEPVYYERAADGNRWFIIARRAVAS